MTQRRDLPARRRRRSPRPAGSFDRRRPFTRAEALEAGITPAALRTKAFRRLMTDVYVDSSVPLTPELAAVAPLALAVPSAWASHSSAARILGVPLPALPGEHVSVTAAADRLRRAGVTFHVAPSTSRIWTRDSVRMSAPAQMFVELATQLNLVDLVVVGDWLVKKELLTLERLLEFVASTRLPGADRAREAARYVRERVDSPMETRVRMLIVLAGIPEPEVNRTIRDIDGVPKRRYDLCWPGVKVIVEYDGRHHVERIEDWEADLERREAIDGDGWRIVVLVAKNVYDRPDVTLERIAGVCGRAGSPECPQHSATTGVHTSRCGCRTSEAGHLGLTATVSHVANEDRPDPPTRRHRCAPAKPLRSLPWARRKRGPCW
jgi:hypothetical protein